MSRDYHLFLDFDGPPDVLWDDLMTECGLKPSAEEGWLTGRGVEAHVAAPTPEQTAIAEPGPGRATAMVTFVPDRELREAIVAVFQISATLMRLHPGDAALTAQDNLSAVLRRGGTVYLDPRQTPSYRVSDEDFAPLPVVREMPPA